MGDLELSSQEPRTEFLNLERYHLTEEEKSQVNLAINVIKSIYPFEPTDRDEWYRNKSNAEQTILSIGNKVLPYLLSKLGSTHDLFKYSLFQDALAETEDLNLVLYTAGLDGILNSHDSSSAYHITNTLNRITASIRVESHRDRRIEFISEKLISILESPHIEQVVKGLYLESLAVTGTAQARSYLNGPALPYFTDHLNELLSLNHIDYLALADDRNRYRFTTWEAINQHRVEYSPITDNMENNYEDAEFGYNDDNIPERVYPDSDADEEETSEKPPEDIDNIKRDAEKAMDIVEKFLENIPGSLKTVEPALNIHIYNFLRENPEADDQTIQSELKKFLKIVEKESDDANNSGLPTVGVEVEVPYDIFPFEDNYKYERLANYLGMMGFIVKREVTINRPTEIEFPPTHSASTQNRMIFEMRKAGLIPTDKRFASMHINLGGIKPFNMRTFYSIIEKLAIEKDTAQSVSDLLTYAFVPAGRIQSRGYFEDAWTIKAAKNLQDTKLSTLDRARLELRTPRIIGSTTYRLIREAQLLGSIVFPTDDERILKLREEFNADVDILLKYYGLEPKEPSEDKYFAAAVLRREYQNKIAGKNNLITDARILMTEYAMKIRKLQKEELKAAA